MKHKHIDSPGAENIPMSPMHRDQRAIERLAIAKARGIQVICRRCSRPCKVLRGTIGTRTKFICNDFRGRE